MDAKEYIRERERMLNTFGRTEGYCVGIFCGDCPLYQGERASCETESAVDIVEAWSAEHPKKTYLDVLLETFPNVVLGVNGVPIFCPHYLGFNEHESCDNTSCIDCWSREYKENK